MPCTTILVGKNASYDGSTMIARNDDSASGHFTPKKFVVVHPEEQPRTYRSELSHVEIGLPDNPMRYTSMQKTVSRRFREESVKRILYISCFRISIVPEKVCSDWEACLSSMEPMR